MIDSAQQPEMQGAFRALADPTRRGILMLLSERDMTIGEVSGRFDMTRAGVKKHLKILEEGALISVHPKGRECFNRIEPAALKPVSDWFDYFNHFWDEKLSKFKEAVEREERNKSNRNAGKSDK